MSWHTFGRLAVVLGVIGAVFLGLMVLNELLPEKLGRVKDLAAIGQAAITMAAIIAGGIYAAAKFELFRDFAPHLTITHEVSHRRVGDSYVHIAVKAALHNTSKVRVDIHSAIFRVHQVAPFTDAEVESLYIQVFEDRDYDELQWPTLDEIRPAWNGNGLIIEPGEAQSQVIEFIVSVDHEAVLVYTYFSNPNYSEGWKVPQGWGEATVYDISEKREEPR